MTIESGGPTDTARSGELSELLQLLVDAAIEEPGVWKNMPVPDKPTPTIRSTLYGRLVRTLADVSIREGRAYLRIKE